VTSVVMIAVLVRLLIRMPEESAEVPMAPDQREMRTDSVAAATPSH
jgi:hypothetical protein